MALDDNNRARLAEFFDGISGHAAAFQHATFSYVAVADGDRWVMLIGSVVMHALAPTVLERRFDSSHARAGIFHLGTGADASGFLTRLTDGAIDTPHGRLEFPAAAGTTPPRHAVNHMLFNPAGNQARLDTLQIMGDQTGQYLHQPILDWHLRGARIPYDGIADLINDYGLPPISSTLSVHLMAQSATMIDVSSRLDGSQAQLAIGLASGLSTESVTIGVLIRHAGGLERRLIESTELTWRSDALRQIGEVSIEVPPGSFLHCFATYDGVTHHRYWVTDPSRTQNQRRTAFESVARSVQIIGDLIAESQAERGLARKLETAVAWLLWLLGFSPAHLGDTAKTQDAPDIVVTTPVGHIALVECTTGFVKTEKLLNLRARASALRQHLDSSALGWLRVLPIIVCARPAIDVNPGRDDAADMGILIADNDDLLDLIKRTTFAPDADRLFTEAEQALAQRRIARADPRA